MWPYAKFSLLSKLYPRDKVKRDIILGYLGHSTSTVDSQLSGQRNNGFNVYMERCSVSIEKQATLGSSLLLNSDCLFQSYILERKNTFW